MPEKIGGHLRGLFALGALARREHQFPQGVDLPIAPQENAPLAKTSRSTPPAGRFAKGRDGPRVEGVDLNRRRSSSSALRAVWHSRRLPSAERRSAAAWARCSGSSKLQLPPTPRGRRKSLPSDIIDDGENRFGFVQRYPLRSSVGPANDFAGVPGDDFPDGSPPVASESSGELLRDRGHGDRLLAPCGSFLESSSSWSRARAPRSMAWLQSGNLFEMKCQ